MVHVKICGLTRAGDVHAARHASAVGVVVASPRSHRNLPLDDARAVLAERGPFQCGVAVTAAKDEATLLDVVTVVRPDAVQVPFGTAEPTLRALAAADPDLRILLAVRPEDAAHAPLARVHALVVDALAADGYGGSGTRTDWAAARDLVARCGKPVILAGGLAPGNVADAVRAVAPYGVDVSSGVEGPDKRKDAALIHAFIDAAHRAGTPRAPAAHSEVES